MNLRGRTPALHGLVDIFTHLSAHEASHSRRRASAGSHGPAAYGGSATDVVSLSFVCIACVSFGRPPSSGRPALPSGQGHGGWSAPMPLPRSVGQLTFFTAGIVHDPSMIEGLLSLGQYIRSIKMNFPGGAGSQLDSLAAPGESFWI